MQARIRTMEQVVAPPTSDVVEQAWPTGSWSQAVVAVARAIAGHGQRRGDTAVA